MQRIFNTQTLEKIGKEVRLCGWVATRRDHGKLVFIDLRDRSGLVQVVGDKRLGSLRAEDVVEINGIAKKRPVNLVNSKIQTGTVEVELKEVKVLSKAKELPFPIDTSGTEINEDTRLKYRYLDLRRKRMIRNLEFRHLLTKSIRRWLDNEGFIEVETPILTKATPEGARDFLVPSRLQPGKFYALPQSPQQYKQLLMVAGLEKYYQIARCLRDEDLRADRQLEFTQLDIEMSFVTREDILSLVERLVGYLTEQHGKKIFKTPIPRFTYKEVMEKFGDDKFDLRVEKDPQVLALAFVTDQPLFEWKEKEKRWDAMHHPFTSPNPEDTPLIEKALKEGGVTNKNSLLGKIRSWQYDLVCNGYEVAGGSIRITDPKLQREIFQIMGHTEEQIKNKFGHLLEAFEYGVPPHGGIAFGFDRLVSVFRNESSIREIIAFPVNSTGLTSVMEAPSEVDKEQLHELGIQIKTAKSYGSLFEKIIGTLDEKKIKYQLFEHEPVHTSQQAAKIRGTKIEQGAKALLMQADDSPVLIVVSGARKVDTGKFKKLYKIKDLRMCTPEEVQKVSGVEIGAVPPFGNLINIKTYMDKSLGKNTKIAFNAGLLTRSIKMNYQDWFDLVKPELGDFSS